MGRLRGAGFSADSTGTTQGARLPRRSLSATFTGRPRMTIAEIEWATQGRYAMGVRDDVIRLTPS